MDLDQLARDWETDPGLAQLTFDNVEQLAKHLVTVHKYLVNPESGGPFAYLYRKQIERNRELQKELEHVRNANPRRR